MAIDNVLFKYTILRKKLQQNKIRLYKREDKHKCKKQSSGNGTTTFGTFST